MSIRSTLVCVVLLLNLLGCSPGRKILQPGPAHGEMNSPPLLVMTDSVQLHLLGNDSLPPPQFVPYDIDPKVLVRATPEYPAPQMHNGIQADVWIMVWVNINGHVSQSVVFKSTDDDFNSAAAIAGFKWEFQPAQIKGKPVSTWIEIPFRFRLKN